MTISLTYSHFDEKVVVLNNKFYLVKPFPVLHGVRTTDTHCWTVDPQGSLFGIKIGNPVSAAKDHPLPCSSLHASKCAESLCGAEEDLMLIHLTELHGNPVCPMGLQKSWTRGITKRCRLSWLTNSTLLYGPRWGGIGLGSCGVSAIEYRCTHGAQINFGDLTPYVIYGPN